MNVNHKIILNYSRKYIKSLNTNVNLYSPLSTLTSPAPPQQLNNLNYKNAIFMNNSKSNTILFNQQQLSSSTPVSDENNDALKKDGKKDEHDPNKPPSLEQLLLIKEKLTEHLPKFFSQTHPYNMYTPDVIFENYYNEEPKVTVGVLPYSLQLTSIRMKVNWKFSTIKVDILKITHDESDGTVQVRWRIGGISAITTMLTPWRVKFWNKESLKQQIEWIDGFSIFYVNSSGCIWKHRVERLMTDKEKELNKQKQLANLAVDPI